MFTASGSTVTANYSRTTVSSNLTLPAGTYSFMGTLTVSSGVTLTISSGAVLNFPAGASLVVNGAVNANGVIFNFTQSYPYSGITINSNGSSLTNCTISGADQPIAINNTSSCTISADSIKNSNFYSSNGVLNSTCALTLDSAFYILFVKVFSSPSVPSGRSGTYATLAPLRALYMYFSNPVFTRAASKD